MNTHIVLIKKNKIILNAGDCKTPYMQVKKNIVETDTVVYNNHKF